MPRSVPWFTYLADLISSSEMSRPLMLAFEIPNLSSSNLHNMHLVLSVRSLHPGHCSSSYCSSSLNSSCSSWIAGRTGAPLTLIITGVTIDSPNSFRRSFASDLCQDLITICFLRLLPRTLLSLNSAF